MNQRGRRCLSIGTTNKKNQQTKRDNNNGDQNQASKQANKHSVDKRNKECKARENVSFSEVICAVAAASF